MSDPYWYIPNTIMNQEDNESEDDSSSDDENSESLESSNRVLTNHILIHPVEVVDWINEMDELDDVIDEIYAFDRDFMRQEKREGQYYLGTVLKKPFWLLDMVISPNAFYRYPYSIVLQYLMEFSVTYPVCHQLRILKLHITKCYSWEFHYVIDKTYWLRLIQRHWRAIYKENRKRLIARKSPMMQRYREIHGKYPIGFNHPLGIIGLLSMYRKPEPSFSRKSQQIQELVQISENLVPNIC